jgi:hypothetical protein
MDGPSRKRPRRQEPAFAGAPSLFGADEAAPKKHRSLKNRIRALKRLMAKPVRREAGRADASPPLHRLLTV